MLIYPVNMKKNGSSLTRGVEEVAIRTLTNISKIWHAQENFIVEKNIQQLPDVTPVF